MNRRAFLTGAVVVLFAGCGGGLTADQKESAVKACIEAELRPDVQVNAFTGKVWTVNCSPWE